MKRDEKIKAVVNIIKKGKAYKKCMTGGMPDEAITVMAEDIADSLRIDKKGVKVDIIKGVEGFCVYIDDYRICGSKPWAGGKSVASYGRVDLAEALTEDIISVKEVV